MEKIFLVLFVIFLCAAMGYGGISALDLASISRAKADATRQEAVNEAIRVQTEQQQKLLREQALMFQQAQEQAAKQQAQTMWLSVVPIFAIATAVVAVIAVIGFFALLLKRGGGGSRTRQRVMYIQQPPQYRQIQQEPQYYLEYDEWGQPQYYLVDNQMQEN